MCGVVLWPFTSSFQGQAHATVLSYTSFASNLHSKTGMPQLFSSKGCLISLGSNVTMMRICKQKNHLSLNYSLICIISSPTFFCFLYTVQEFVCLWLKTDFSASDLPKSCSLPRASREWRCCGIIIREAITTLGEKKKTKHIKFRSAGTSFNCYKDWVESICLSCCPCTYHNGSSLVKGAQTDKKHIHTSEADGVW